MVFGQISTMYIWLIKRQFYGTEVFFPGQYVPVLSCSVNAPLVPAVEAWVQAAHRKQFWVEEDGSSGEQPGSVSGQQRESMTYTEPEPQSEPELNIVRHKNFDKTFSFSSLLLVTGVILGSKRLEAVGGGGGSSRCSTSCIRSSASWRLHTLKVLGRNTASLRRENCCSSSCREGGGGERLLTRQCLCWCYSLTEQGPVFCTSLNRSRIKCWMF